METHLVGETVEILRRQPDPVLWAQDLLWWFLMFAVIQNQVKRSDSLSLLGHRLSTYSKPGNREKLIQRQHNGNSSLEAIYQATQIVFITMFTSGNPAKTWFKRQAAGPEMYKQTPNLNGCMFG